ncbi:MAG TPA: PocR ligand-binding domain-containing protein [Clostridia bacterium]|nr:PocR ligand-binding domain-containing protein [Clostridia bacterium]
MTLWNDSGSISEDVGFDIDTCTLAMEHYARSTEVGISIIDTRGESIHSTGYSGETCKFCNKVRGLLDSQGDYCSKVHLYGGYQSERFGGKYIFFCPMGLVHWSSPISFEGIVKGYLLCGPALMVEPEDFLIEDFLIKNHIKKKYLEGLKAYLDHVAVITPDKVTSLSELLFMISSHISDAEHMQYLDQMDFHHHQSDMSQYIHMIKTMGGDQSQISSYPFEKEKELLSCISLGDQKGSKIILNEVLGHVFFSSGGDFETMKARILELIVLLSRAAMEGGADVEQIFGLNYKYLNAIHGFKTVEELTYWLSKIMIRFTDCVFNLKDIKHVDVIYKAVNYIKTNYMNKITLEEVSSHVYLSPSYFSKVFKDDMKCNFNTYVNQIRVERSKQLLLNHKANLVDISNMVGYEDQSYFSKVFKRIVGVTPGRYREGRGQPNTRRKNHEFTK